MGVGVEHDSSTGEHTAKFGLVIRRRQIYNLRHMTKQEQFLWLVQTIILTNAVNVASQPDYVQNFRHVVGAVGVSHTAREALWASDRIPAAMDASEAAGSFCEYMLHNLRTEEALCPSWFSRR